MAPAILTRSGRIFRFDAPTPAMVNIFDIAHALSYICRFTGHVNAFYSVAQHSVMVSFIVPPADALAGLLHDATEAYLGDVSRPLKQLLPQYQALETLAHQAIFEHFGLDPVLPASVHHADQIMLVTEKRDLMPRRSENWQEFSDIPPLPKTISVWDSFRAESEFLLRYNQLTRREAA